MTKSIFDYMNSIFLKSGNIYSKQDKVSVYLLSMYLSHDRQLLPIVEKINRYQFQLDDHMIYQYYYDRVPKGKRFIKWVKKDEKDKKVKEKTDKFREEFLLSRKEVSDLL